MLKLIALISMFSDHLAKAFFFSVPRTPLYIVLVIIGRISMPIFGYCIARGYNHYKKHGNMKKYFRNLIIFSICSQPPFTYFLMYFYNMTFINACKLNIGFLWLFSLLALYILEKVDLSITKQNLIRIILLILIAVGTVFLQVDYGFYGLLFPIVFYFLYFKYNSPILLTLSVLVLHFIYYLEHINFKDPFSLQIQAVAVFSIFIILGLQKYDRNIRLPKFIFYWFYPIHLAIFILIKYLLESHILF